MSRYYVGVLVFMLSAWIPAHADQGKVYAVGVVPQFDTRKIREIWQPILKELHEQTGYKFELKGSPTIPQFEKEFNQGMFDFAYMNPYHALLANKSQGYIPIVRDVGRQLFGVLTVKKDGPIKTLQDLEGKLVAFPAPNALGASLLIRADLKENHNINIKPRYVKTHNSVYLNVVLEQSVAGGGVQKTFNRQAKNIKSKLHILYKTSKVSPHPLTVHPRVENKVQMAVRGALIKMGETDKGIGLLAKIPMRKVGVTSMEDYKALESMGLERYYVAN